MRELLEQLFPRLRTTTFEITSPRDGRYNCIAWAAGETHRWWWPGEALFSFWPAGVDREESLASFVAAFATLGYEVAESGDHDPDYEKIAIFASNDGVPTHMVRQLLNGSWTSKLGGLEDIAHIDVSGVAGTEYGDVVAVLQRHRTPAHRTSTTFSRTPL
jgi:hypothetical protein